MNSDTRVVITGMGVVSPVGIGKDKFWEALIEGTSGISPLTMFDTSIFKNKNAAQINDFDAAEYLGSNGLKYFDRSTVLILTAAKLALDGHRIPFSDRELEESGVVVGTAFGGLHSIGEFDRESIDNPNYVNPMHFPNTVINSPASQVSVRYGMRCMNVTMSTGFAAGTDALGNSFNYIRSGMAGVIFAGGVEELCIESFAAFSKNGLLAGRKENCEERVYPYDKRRDGMILGEGAVLLVMENLQLALERGDDILAEVIGYGTSCDASFKHNFNSSGTRAKTAMIMAMEEAGVSPLDIDYICGSANGSVEGDKMEYEALEEIFGDDIRNKAVSSIKASVGECVGASGAFQTAASVLAINKGIVPPTLNFEMAENEKGSLNIIETPDKRDIDIAMINSFGCNGINSSLIIRKFKA
ncbi:MAG TPA: beta-ketoacyl-[acyl-carrier-protein] synthase family protein [Clostridia bacterium]